MRSGSWVWGVVVIVLLSVGLPPNSYAVDDNEAIRSVIETYTDLVNAKQFRSVAELFLADGELLFSYTPDRVGQEAIFDWYERIIAPIEYAQTSVLNKISVMGNKAIAHVDTRATVASSEFQGIDYYRDLFILSREGASEWKIQQHFRSTIKQQVESAAR